MHWTGYRSSEFAFKKSNLDYNKNLLKNWRKSLKKRIFFQRMSPQEEFVMAFEHKQIEKKWQNYWLENKTFKTSEDKSKPKFYALDMFP